MATTNLTDEVIIRGIKLIDIAWITLVYFILAAVAGLGFEKYYGSFDSKKYDTYSDFQLILDTAWHIALVGIVCYIARNTVPLIPFPFEGVRGFQHARVKEVANATVFTVIVVAFQPHLQDKIKYTSKRIKQRFLN